MVSWMMHRGSSRVRKTAPGPGLPLGRERGGVLGTRNTKSFGSAGSLCRLLVNAMAPYQVKARGRGPSCVVSCRMAISECPQVPPCAPAPLPRPRDRLARTQAVA